MIENIIDTLGFLNLKLADDKCKAMVFGHDGHLQRNPIFKIEDKSIPVKSELIYLGITMDNQFKWLAHIGKLKEKALWLANGFNRVGGANWGVSPFLKKIWYQSVVLAFVRYGSAIWGSSLNSTHRLALFSLQRLFLTKIARAYCDTSNVALNVLTGCPPLHLVIDAEVKKYHILKKQDLTYLPSSLEGHAIPISVTINDYHPNHRIPSNVVDIDAIKYEIYTDGSKLNGRVGCAFCVFVDGELIHSDLFKLSEANTVFQAELLGILRALHWLNDNRAPSRIWSDSESAIKAIFSPKNKLSLVWDIRNLLFSMEGFVNLSWVKAHVGIVGNEKADELAKLATTDGLYVPIPFSHGVLKGILKRQLLKDWQSLWDGHVNGRPVYKYFPKVDMDCLVTIRDVVLFTSEHGPSMEYLNRKRIMDSPDCDCGDIGTLDHYVFDCPFTHVHHLSRPSVSNCSVWLKNVMENKILLSRLHQCLIKAKFICDNN